MNTLLDGEFTRQRDAMETRTVHARPAFRELRMLRRLAELFLVLALAMACTVLHLLFGWVALVFALYGKPKTLKTAYIPQQQ